jgi:hypothetical protein
MLSPSIAVMVKIYLSFPLTKFLFVLIRIIFLRFVMIAVGISGTVLTWLVKIIPSFRICPEARRLTRLALPLQICIPET